MMLPLSVHGLLFYDKFLKVKLIILPIDCLRKRNAQIRFHKKYVWTRNIVKFHIIKVTNSTIFSNFVERLQKLFPHTFSLFPNFVENRSHFRKSISTSDFTDRIRTFILEEFRFVNSAFTNTLTTDVFYYRKKNLEKKSSFSHSFIIFLRVTFFWIKMSSEKNIFILWLSPLSHQCINILYLLFAICDSIHWAA